MSPRKRRPKVTRVNIPSYWDPEHPIHGMDLLSGEATMRRCTQSLQRQARLHPKRAIYLHDPLGREGGAVVDPKDLLGDRHPEHRLLSRLLVSGCCWDYWQRLGEA